MKFINSKGSAKKRQIDQYTYKNGDNSVRIFGDLLPRYIYWIRGDNDKNLPIECLAFDRETESFTSKDQEWVKEFFPDATASGAYSSQCIDLSDGKAKVFNLKKKLMDQVLQAAEELGDPTDLENGWEVWFKRSKTGPHVYNVEYQLDQIKCLKNQKPVTSAQRAEIEAATPISELLPRPTPEVQKELLDKLHRGESAGEDNTDTEVSKEFDVS